MACRLFGTETLSKPMLGYYQLDPQQQTSVITKLFIHENASENIVCQNGGHFVQEEMSFKDRALK